MSVNSLHITDTVLADLRLAASKSMTFGPGNVEVPAPVLKAILEYLEQLEWDWHKHTCRDEWG